MGKTNGRRRKKGKPWFEELFDEANGDLALGDLESAVEKYRHCTQLAPDFFDGWHALGMALMKLGVLRGSYSIGFYVWMALLGFAVGISTDVASTWWVIRNHFDFREGYRDSLAWAVAKPLPRILKKS